MDVKNKVDVSIITPFYNEPLWMLKRNVASVMGQVTDYNFEHLIVIDDPQPKDEIIQYLLAAGQAYRMGFQVHLINQGLSTTRNTALKKASGEYIMLLDADDCFAPNRITTQLDYMKANNYDHTYGGYMEVHGNGDLDKLGRVAIIPPEFSVDYLLDMHNICYCGSNCFKREIYVALGGFDENMKEGAEDLEYWLRLATNGYRSGAMKEVLYYLGIHGDNMTAKLVSNGGFGRAYEYIKKKHSHLKFK